MRGQAAVRAKLRGPLAIALVGCITGSMLVATPSRAAHPGDNGARIVYTTGQQVGPGQFQDTLYISTIKTDGTEAGRLLSLPAGRKSHVEYSPDGQKISLTAWTQDPLPPYAVRPHVFIANADGTNPVQIPAPQRSTPEGSTLGESGGSWSPDGKKIAYQCRVNQAVRGWEACIHDLQTGTETIVTTRQDDMFVGPPAWSPTGGILVFNVQRDVDSDPWTPDQWDIWKASTADVEAAPTPITDDAAIDDAPSFSPDGNTIIFHRRPAGETYEAGLAQMGVGGGPTMLFTPTANTRAFRYPDFSPDGKKIVFSGKHVSDASTYTDIWIADYNGSGPLTNLVNVTNDASWFDSQPSWQPIKKEANVLDVRLDAFSPGGEAINGIVTVAQTVTVKLILRNTSETITLNDFTFTGQPLVVDGRSTGCSTGNCAMKIVSGPEPQIPTGLTLGPGESETFAFELDTIAKGRVALHSRVTAEDEDETEHVDAHSLLADLDDGMKVTKELGQYLRLLAMERFVQETYGHLHKVMTRAGNEMSRKLDNVMTPAQRKKWFGSETGFPTSPRDVAAAALRGGSATLMSTMFPEKRYEGFTAEELEKTYDDTFWDTVGKGVSKHIDGYKDLAGSVKKGLQASWAEANLAAAYYMGGATPDERLQFEAHAMRAIDATAAGANNIANMVKREIPKWRENGTYFHEALKQANEDLNVYALGLKIKDMWDDEQRWQRLAAHTAQKDPEAYMKKVAAHNAEIFTKGFIPIAETLLGGGVSKGTGLLKGLVFKKEAAAVMRAGEAAGVLDEGGNVVKGASTAIKAADEAIPLGPTNMDIVELEKAGKYLDDVEGATIVHSSDLGNVYEMPNLGGVPETTLDAKAGILKELENGYAEKFPGKPPLKLAEVLKPSSAYRKPGGVAKLELTGQKTGKAPMLDAGAPPDILGEANVWHGPDPRKAKGFNKLPKARQQAAVTEWKNAEKRWAEWNNPAPGSKTARLQQCAKPGGDRVPLDLKPNEAGLQRFVKAEFELVPVAHGKAEGMLIRVKKYEIEVELVKPNGERTLVNGKTVVNSPTKALPQTPDADGVALAKVEVRDGKEVLVPLSREEREYVMQRYIDKNIKARRKPPGSKGAIPDNAEHGLTLNMDDASAFEAGKLIPQYGSPFVPKGPGTNHLQRIARSLAKGDPEEAEQMYKKMLQVVESEGGFGQHAVVLTSDSRYLGEVPFAHW